MIDKKAMMTMELDKLADYGKQLREEYEAARKIYDFRKSELGERTKKPFPKLVIESKKSAASKPLGN